MGQIFEGVELSPVLQAHIDTFGTIASMPTELEIAGEEPSLTVEVRTRLFSIAHNALANAFRHSSASQVKVQLQFRQDSIRLAVSDDGIGLPTDYEARGHGFRNMRRDAALIGGRLLVESPRIGEGTTVVCIIGADHSLSAAEPGVWPQ